MILKRGEILLDSNNVVNGKDKAGGEAAAKYLKYGLIGFAGLIVIAVALIIYFSYSSSYVAKVGNEKITAEEFKFFLKQEKANMLAIAGSADESTFWNTKIDGENAIDVAKRKALERARDLKIQVIKAREQGIKLEKEEQANLDNGIKQFIQQYNNSTTEANKASVEAYGVKLNSVKEVYRQYMLMQKLVQKEYEDLKVSEDEIETYYNKNPDWFKDSGYRQNAEEAVWARHILVMFGSENPSQEDKDKARKKAEDILKKAKDGGDFAALAKENSEDTGSAQFGGDYVFGRGKMAAEFDKASFELAPGGISGLVETVFGYHIIKLEEKYGEGQPVSLKCAGEYREFGVSRITSKLYEQKLEAWKKEPAYEMVKNQGVYNSISR